MNAHPSGDDTVVLQVEVHLRKDGIDIQKIFTVSCRYVPEFRYCAIYFVSEER